MNKVLLLLLLLFGFVFCYAQNHHATKEQLLKDINNLYKSTYKFWDESGEEIFVESVTLQNGKLAKRYTSGSYSISDLIANEPIEIREYLTSYGFRIIYSIEPSQAIFGNISTESDAIRLKKYLEDLIEILNDN